MRAIETTSNDTLLREETFASLWEVIARSREGQPALRFQGREVSYCELDRRTDRIAENLRLLGIGRGAKVLVSLNRSVELHATIIGVLKSGAAYVPVDAETPADRLAVVLEECEGAAVIVDDVVGAKIAGVVPSEKIRHVKELLVDRCADHGRREGPRPDDTAYIIFTSGSTGKPKGIAVSHRSLCHFLRSENSILGIRAEDLVWQGFSIAFDMWIEECLIAYSVGACLEVATQDDVRAVDVLSERIARAGVTVLHIVPTLAAAIGNNIPSLRLINFGGEACPAPLVKRWARDGRRLFNTYGPTETTVTATMTELFVGREVTIGRPLPNYTAYVVNEKLEPVKQGERGELLIGGPGVSQGYVNRTDLNPAKFIANPFGAGGGDPTLYRTGDAVSVNKDGELEFHGRIDTQVKIRGFRVELEEIETALADQAGVRTAAVKLETDASGMEHLVAFFVAADGQAPSIAELRKQMQARLPSYMMPTEIKRLEKMPTLTSGKVDRKSLPKALENKTAGLTLLTNETEDPTLTKAERTVTYAVSKLFGGTVVAKDADFFLDLGGHSLLAAALVSELRKYPGAEGLSIADVYKHRSIRKIAGAIELSSRASYTEHEVSTKLPRHESTALAYALCTLGQAAGLFVIFGMWAIQFVGIYLAYDSSLTAWGSETIALGAMALTAVLVPWLMFAFTVATKWLVLGRVKAGDYPVHSSFYLRFWFVRRVKDATPNWLIAGTPFFAIYLRALGAKVGEGCDIGQISVDAEDLVEIGDDVAMSAEVILDNARIENGWLRLGKIKVGAHSYLGTTAILGSDTEVGAWSEVGDLAHVTDGTKVPAREIWRGSPAAHVAKLDIDNLPRPLPRTRAAKLGINAAYVAMCAALSLSTAVPLFFIYQTMGFIYDLSAGSFLAVVMTAPLLAAKFLGTFALEFWVLRWLVMGKMPAGEYPTNGAVYMRKWFVDQLGKISLLVMHPVYASLYLPMWFRALGAKIGKRAEVSTASGVTYHLLELGDESFVADKVALGDPMIRNGWMELKHTKIGTRSFIGNAAVVADGTVWPDGALLGVLSTTPEHDARVPEQSTWLGVPSSQFPRRESVIGFDEASTYRPRWTQYLGRGIIEGLRILAPYTSIFICANLFVTALFTIEESIGYAAYLLLPILYAGLVAVPGFLFLAALKWTLVGKYRPAKWAMWTRQVWISEAITCLYEALAVPQLLEPLRGTPFLPFFLRLLGVKIGRRVIMDTTDVTEFDMVELGDGAVMEEGSGAQSHLFEDRVMKIGTVKIGERATVGSRAIVLYDAELERDVTLHANTLIMKGERVPAETSWVGVPAVAAKKTVPVPRAAVPAANEAAAESVTAG